LLFDVKIILMLNEMKTV